MKKILSFACFSIILISCTKNDDAGGNEILQGRLSYIDPYVSAGTFKALAGREIKIAYHPSDTLNFLYSVKTDSEGYFLFNRLEKNKSYALFFRDTIGGISYLAYQTFSPPNDTISLQAFPDTGIQSVLSFRTKNDQGQPVKSEICIYNSMLAFSTESCSFAIRQLTTDESGNQAVYGLPPGTYYIRATTTIGDQKLKAEQTTTITGSGHQPVSLILMPNNTFQNGMKITVRDDGGFPVNNTALCIFNNRTLFLTDSCQGNIFTVFTNQQGEAKLTNVQPGKYFVQAWSKFGNISLSGKDSLIVNAMGITDSVMIVR